MQDIPNSNSIIVNYYILPLLGICFSQLKEDYNKGFIDKQGAFVFLEFEEITNYVYSDEYFHGTTIINEKFYQIYSIPEKFLPDIQIILNGRYSKLSDKAKDNIIKLSGLSYNRKDPKTGKFVTSTPILALSKSVELKKYQENRLGYKIKYGRQGAPVELPLDSELLDIPTENIYIDSIL